MIRRIYLDGRGEMLRMDELQDHELELDDAIHDLIHAVAIATVTIEYKAPMSRNGVDGITHVQYEGFYPPEHEVEDLGYGGDPCGDDEEG